jgi:hypothetical protein
MLGAAAACRNLLAVCFIICVQQNLSLRSQIVNPLLVIFMVLASTAALVRTADCRHGGCQLVLQQQQQQQ